MSCFMSRSHLFADGVKKHGEKKSGCLTKKNCEQKKKKKKSYLLCRIPVEKKTVYDVFSFLPLFSIHQLN